MTRPRSARRAASGLLAIKRVGGRGPRKKARSVGASLFGSSSVSPRNDDDTEANGPTVQWCSVQSRGNGERGGEREPSAERSASGNLEAWIACGSKRRGEERQVNEVGERWSDTGRRMESLVDVAWKSRDPRDARPSKINIHCEIWIIDSRWRSFFAFRDTILGITTTAASIQLGNFCTSTIKGVSNRKERVVRCFFRVF